MSALEWIGLTALIAFVAGGILGVVDGRAELINASACVGHGECALECPVGATSPGFGARGGNGTSALWGTAMLRATLVVAMLLVASALECRSTVWVGLPCRGVGGCKVTANIVSCDMNGSLAGDLCASTAEGRGLCATDVLGTLECRSGAFVETNTCRSCTVQGDTVICQP